MRSVERAQSDMDSNMPSHVDQVRIVVVFASIPCYFFVFEIFILFRAIN